MISLERKRSERTQRPFVLLLMDTGRNLPTEKNGRILLEILSALQAATRETDVMAGTSRTQWWSDVHRDYAR